MQRCAGGRPTRYSQYRWPHAVAMHLAFGSSSDQQPLHLIKELLSVTRLQLCRSSLSCTAQARISLVVRAADSIVQHSAPDLWGPKLRVLPCCCACCAAASAGRAVPAAEQQRPPMSRGTEPCGISCRSASEAQVQPAECQLSYYQNTVSSNSRETSSGKLSSLHMQTGRSLAASNRILSVKRRAADCFRRRGRPQHERPVGVYHSSGRTEQHKPAEH